MSKSNNTKESIVLITGFLLLFIAVITLHLFNRPPEEPLPPSTNTPTSTPTPCKELGSETICANIKDVPNVPKGNFRYGGSTTFAPLGEGADIFRKLGRPDVVATIKQAHPNFDLIYTHPQTGQPGSGKGIEMLLAGELNFSQSSREVKEKEFQKAISRSFKLKQVAVAIDGIAFFVHPDLVNRGLKSITLEQVRGIFIGEIMNWNQIKSDLDVPIVPCSRNLKDGGTVDFLHEKILKGQKFGTNIQEVPDTTTSIQKVIKTPGGIGYATTSEVISKSQIRILSLAKDTNSLPVSPCANDQCTAVNQTAFKYNSYPLTRRLFVVIKQDGGIDQQAGTAYANMLLSNEGQKLIEQAGFVPLRVP
ncbi:phosphate ABC transporter substrate-binding protein [Hapalosiphon sp. MRB220]|nr:phosphate ABC transporter substrate-binding protein [Hapalosiphon sp. MRB220]